MSRKLPLLNPENATFWTSGADGKLRVCCCGSCDTQFHPPQPICPRCGSMEVGYTPVSGRGRVVSYTINHQPWRPDLEVPYVVAVVELVEQKGVRFVTNIIGCPVDQVHIGMPVRVVFENVEDVWIPLFVADV